MARKKQMVAPGGQDIGQRTAPQLRFRQLTYVYDLLLVLVVRDLKIRYKRSLVGIGWSLINPLAELLILGFVFGRILAVGIPNYAVFLFTGLLAWNWFSGGLLGATDVIVNNPSLVKLPGFPTAMLPVATVTTFFVHFLIALPILLIFILISDLDITVAVLSAPVVMMIQFILTLSLGYFLAALHVNFRDTQYLLSIALKLGFFLTGIFFDPSQVEPQYQWVFLLNPMSLLIEAYRMIFVQGVHPDPLPLTILAAISSLLLILGLTFFKKASRSFAEEV